MYTYAYLINVVASYAHGKRYLVVCGVFLLFLGVLIVAMTSLDITKNYPEAFVPHPASALTYLDDNSTAAAGNEQCTSWGGTIFLGTPQPNKCVCNKNWHHDVYLTVVTSCAMPTYWPYFSSSVIAVFAIICVTTKTVVPPSYVQSETVAYFGCLLMNILIVIAFGGIAAGEPRIFHILFPMAMTVGNMLDVLQWRELGFRWRHVKGNRSRPPISYELMFAMLLYVLLPVVVCIGMVVLTALDAKVNYEDRNVTIVVLWSLLFFARSMYDVAAINVYIVPLTARMKRTSSGDDDAAKERKKRGATLLYMEASRHVLAFIMNIGMFIVLVLSHVTNEMHVVWFMVVAYTLFLVTSCFLLDLLVWQAPSRSSSSLDEEEHLRNGGYIPFQQPPAGEELPSSPVEWVLMEKGHV